MAIENNYGGPPSLEIYQDFGQSAGIADIDQNVVIVAPHYDVMKEENASTSDYKTYSMGTASSVTWASLERAGTDVDTAGVSVVFRDAWVSQAKVDGEVTGNVLVLKDCDVDDRSKFPEPVLVGTKVALETSTGARTITDIIAIRTGSVTPATPVATRVSGGSTSTAGAFTVSGTYSGTKDKIYYVKVSKVIVVEDEESIEAEVSTFDGTDEDTISFTDTTAVPLANSGLMIAVSAWGFEEDSYYQIVVRATGSGTRNTLYLKEGLSNTSETPVTVYVGTQKTFSVPRTMYQVTQEGIRLPDDLKHDAYIGSDTVYNTPVIEGKFFVEYRAISKKFDGVLKFITNDKISEVGYTGVENPMGAMVNVALKGGAGVYCTSVAEDSVTAYRKAFVLLSRSSNAYGVVIGSTREDVILEAASFVKTQSDPEVANYKILYYGLDNSSESPVMTEDSKGNRLVATIDGGTVTLESDESNSDDSKSYDFVTAGVRPGDTFRTNYGVDSRGVTTFTEFTVEYVKDGSTLVLTNGSVTTPIGKVFEIYRTLSGSELVDVLKGRVYVYSHRCYCVFGDGLTVHGIKNAPTWLIAALPAGMRAGSPCQRPISNLSYDGCSADNRFGFNAADLKSLASRGVWIIANNADGTYVYNYHQLSTDMRDKKHQEQSYTTNFDSISRSARAIMAPHYGNSNISDEFIQQLHADLVALLGGFTTNAPSIEVGPQLLGYDNLTLRQDKVNTDHIYMEVDYDMPAPFNHVKMYQRLI